MKHKLLSLIKNVRKDSKKLVGVGVLGTIVIVLLVSFIRGLIIASHFEDFQSFSPKDLTKNKNLLLVNQLIGLSPDKKGRVGVIKNVESLSKRHSEFSKAKNGDIVVSYSDMTIIYDPLNNNVVDISTKNLLR